MKFAIFIHLCLQNIRYRRDRFDVMSSTKGDLKAREELAAERHV
jgi:hypothetical protein